MSGAIRTNAVYSHKPWRRFAIALPLSSIIVSAGLFCASLVKPAARPRIEFNAIEVYLMPPPAQSAGLCGEAVLAPAKSKSIKKMHRTAAPKVYVFKARPAPPPSAYDEATRSAPQSSAPAAMQPPGATSHGAAALGATSEGAVSSVGTNTAGALAIYAPLPRIPDDLREEDFESVAVAHFTVLGDSTVTVFLLKPTRNLRLNQILLDALGQWRFYPARKGGVTIDSEFDVRIPISVQ